MAQATVVRGICAARVPPSTYIKDARRCEKPARVRRMGVGLCRHHEAVAQRGALGLWAPALEGRRR